MAIQNQTRAAVRIVATVGPASESATVIERMIEAGVGVFRLNFSHGSLDDHGRRLATIREVSGKMGAVVAVLGDLCGPKIRVGKVGGDGIVLEPGQDVVIDPGAKESSPGKGKTAAVLTATYQEIGQDVEPGQRVLINDGAVRLLAVGREGATGLRCRVVVGGLVTSGKGINLPQSKVSLPALTDRDRECARWAAGADLDYLALSFVRTAEEIGELKRLLAEAGATIPVVAKIEKPQAVERMDEIVEAADVVMVARGDLGVEMELAQVPLVQKKLVACCASWGKACIVATQMLETMVESPVPTRAEVSDVANAVLDGADAVMLSAETAAGKHPALVVETMRRIVEATEEPGRVWAAEATPPGKVVETGYRPAALAHGAWQIAKDSGARAVACWSQRSGASARLLSQMGFPVPILAYSSSTRQTRRMMLLRGVVPIAVEPPKDGLIATWSKRVDMDLRRLGIANAGDTVVLMTGRPVGGAGSTNTVAVHQVGAEERVV